MSDFELASLRAEIQALRNKVSSLESSIIQITGGGMHANVATELISLQSQIDLLKIHIR